MQTVSSYGVEIRKQNIPIRQTLEIYRQAVSYLTEIYEQVWAELKMIPEAKKRFNAAEHLIHTTKKNHAHFDFDIRFPKMPSYLRRAAIQHALGSVSSYESRMEQWEAAGELSGKPNFTCENHAMPVFYRDVMYREGTEGKDEAYLKLYDGHDWRWFRVCLSHTDMEYLRRNWYGKKASAPTLEKLINFLPRIVPSGRMMVQTASVLMPRSTLQIVCSLTGVWFKDTSSAYVKRRKYLWCFFSNVGAEAFFPDQCFLKYSISVCFSHTANHFQSCPSYSFKKAASFSSVFSRYMTLW